jgi:predicted SnoaL-like aldol condensation-catalyzing enzyme
VLTVGGGVIGSEPNGPGAATIEQNKATVRRWSDELWGRGNLAVADEIIAADYVRHDPGDPFPARGPEDVKRIVTMLRSMLPDFRIEVEAIIAEGDMVVSRYTATATDSVGYMGMPPTGKAIRTRRFRSSGSHTARSSRAGPRATISERFASWAICPRWNGRDKGAA